MELTILQLSPEWENPGPNLEKVERLLKASPPKPGGLIILPEMFSTGFSLDLSRTCAGAATKAEAFVSKMATRFQAAIVAGTTRLGSDGLGRNEAVVYGPSGELLARYLKQRPFSGAGEDLAHERGFKGATFLWSGMRVAPLICYDLRFPELFRGAAKAGAEMYVVIAAWPSKRIEHWITLLRARAIENQAYVIGVNRTGEEPKFHYSGRSVVVDPHGEILHDAGEEECVLHAKLDPRVPQEWRDQFPAYNDFLRWG
jgi:omega-amidase